MIKEIKNKIYFFMLILLILYFILNLLGGNRGLFSYFEKKGFLYKLENDKKILSQERWRHKTLETKPNIIINLVTRGEDVET